MSKSKTYRAGTDSGSLMNVLMSGPAQIKPMVGMGATTLHWSDRRAGTIIEVSPDDKRIVVQEDTATRTDGNGMSDAQSYEYAPNPNGAKSAFTLRKNGAYVREGEPLKGGLRVLIGQRQHYYDYSF